MTSFFTKSSITVAALTFLFSASFAQANQELLNPNFPAIGEAYLNEFVYDDIREDFNKINYYYDSVREDFVGYLNMPTFTEDMNKAAFATIISYGMTAYGENPSTTDAEVLVQSPTMACAAYVIVAWELIERLGVSTEKQVGLGWDDGAVGNHAQMLMTDGSSSALLDPTIGLVSEGVTIDGLTSGTTHNNYRVFKHRDEILSFKDKVVSAVSTGSYAISDFIYFIPGYENMLTKYHEYQGYREDGPNGVTWVGSTKDDEMLGTEGSDHIWGGRGDDNVDGAAGDDQLSGGKGVNVIDGGSGSDAAVFLAAVSDYFIQGSDFGEQLLVEGGEEESQVLNVEKLIFSDTDISVIAQKKDEEDLMTWSTITTFFNEAGEAAQVYYKLDGGDEQYYNYDVSGDWDWEQKVIKRDAHRNIFYVLYENDDQTSISYQYDVANSTNWKELVTEKNAKGKNTKTTHFFDNGHKDIYQYDVNDQYRWERAVVNFDSNNARTSVDYLIDDGSRIIYEYDVERDRSWETIESHYNISGERAKIIYDFDNGEQSVYSYDLDNLQVWEVLQTNFNAGGERTKVIYNYENNTRIVYAYDPARVEDWVSMQTNFNAGGERTKVIYRYEGDTTTTYIFDPTTGGVIDIIYS